MVWKFDSLRMGYRSRWAIQQGRGSFLSRGRRAHETIAAGAANHYDWRAAGMQFTDAL
jgi:hypothetical protein